VLGFRELRDELARVILPAAPSWIRPANPTNSKAAER
jgi:hypothetical protein